MSSHTQSLSLEGDVPSWHLTRTLPDVGPWWKLQPLCYLWAKVTTLFSIDQHTTTPPTDRPLWALLTWCTTRRNLFPLWTLRPFYGSQVYSVRARLLDVKANTSLCWNIHRPHSSLALLFTDLAAIISIIWASRHPLAMSLAWKILHCIF